MKCISCKHELDSSMKHAITMNSCPFCGKSVFSNGEFDFRKSIYRILIKNGLEDEVLMSKIVDDVSTSLRENIITVPDEEVSVEDDSQEDDDDGIGAAPSRKLTPPPDAKRNTQPESKPNFVDAATKIWERAQNVDDYDDRPRAGRMEEDEGGGDDIPFFAETSNQSNPKIEELKRKAAGQLRPGFKNTPKK